MKFPARRPAGRALRGPLALLAAALLGLAAAGCESGPPPDSVSGVVRLEPSLPPEAQKARTLLIVLEPEGGGAPLAVQRLVEPKLPYRYVLTADDLVANRPFAGRVRVRARLDADGLLGPLFKGDFQGVSAGAVPIGARGVDVLINEMGTAEPPKKVAKRPRKAAKPGAGAPPQAAASPPPPAGGATITGTVRVAPALAAKAAGKRTLFLIARTERPGPPLAVLRIENPRLPQAFTLSQANVMVQGVPFAGSVRLTARLDADGSVGAGPGDLEGSAPGPVAVGAKEVAIVLDREVGAAASAAPPAPPAPAPMPPQAAPPPLPPPGAAAGAISGTIEVAPALAARAAGKAVLYLIARPEGGGPPVAVQRLDNPRFPQAFTLSGQHGMGGGGLQGRVRVVARLDADGNAGPPAPGDLEGATKEPVEAGAAGVRIVLDKAY